MTMRIGHRSVVGVAESPFTLSQQVYAHPGEVWSAELDFPPLERAEAEDLIGMLLALNGMEGTFLMGDPLGKTARGTWSGSSPVVSGAHAAGLKTIGIRNVDGKTWKRGDWLQFGSGSTTHLHKIVQDGSQVGSPSLASIEIWPRTRTTLADGDAITIASPRGLWRLASNVGGWDLIDAMEYGVRLSAIEALSA